LLKIFYKYTYRFYHFKFWVFFTKSNCCDFSAKDEWPPIHPISMHWIIMFGRNAESYHKLQPKHKCTLADLVSLTRESHWQCCERLLQASATTCVSQRWKFWIYNVITHICRYWHWHLYLAICHMMGFVFEKFREFHNKLNWIVKIWGVLLVKVLFINIQINGPKLVGI